MTLSSKAKWIGLLAASLVAWALTVLFDLFPVAFGVLGNRLASTPDPYLPDITQLKNWITLYAFFGLPIAVPFVSIAGFILWNRQERRGRTSKSDAWWSGAIVGLSLGAALSGLTFLNGLQTQADPHSSFNSWNYGYQVTRDGMPTALGWLFQLFDVATTTFTGAVAGLSAWALARLVDRKPSRIVHDT